MTHRYLNLTPLPRALAVMRQKFPPPGGAESVPLQLAVGRVTAEPIYAVYSVPMVDIAKFDGYAVRSGETLGAQDQRPLTLTNYSRINTGEVLPPAFDAVIMVEDTWEENGRVWIRKSAARGQNIRRAGEDIRAGELVLPKGHQIRPFDIGAVATYGITSVMVRAVRVGIIPTGSDLVPPGTLPRPGQTVETNTLMADAYLSGMGATCRRYGVVPDEPHRIREAVAEAVAENDLVLLSAGTSTGSRDFSREAIAELGEILFHGIAMRPGKPVLLAGLDGKPVFGMPGYPVSAQTVLREVVANLLVWWGLAPPPLAEMDARLASRLASDLGFDEFVPVSVGRVNGTCWATPHPRGGGIQMAVVRANGYLHVPAWREGIEAGEVVRVSLTAPSASIARTIVCVGKRDPALEKLGNRLQDSGYLLHCCNASTMGAVLALRANTCHAASIVLPDTESAWNDQVFRYLPGVNLLRLPLARTELGIASTGELDPERLALLRVANRPKSQAAQVLLDAWLEREGIGYPHQDQDLAAGAKVRVCADAEAREAGLSFIPIGYESCNLVIRGEVASEGGIAALIRTTRSQEFRAYLRTIGREPAGGAGDEPLPAQDAAPARNQ